MTRRPSFAVATALAVSTFGLAAHAVGTRAFDLGTLDDLSGGELVATSVDSLGRVRAGLSLGTVSLGDPSSVWSALPLADGSVLLGTGNDGKIVQVRGAQASIAGETGQLAVTSLTLGWGGAVYAGTMPKGRIVKLEGGKVTTFVDLPETDHVWALVFDAKAQALYAATGPQGKLWRIDRAGAAQVYYDADEPHLVSLVAGPGGALYAGSSGKALLYKITGPGRASVVYDFPGEEVRALAVGPHDTLFAVSNEYGEPPEIPRRPAATALGNAGPVTAARPKAGKGTLTRFDADGRPERLLRREDTHFSALGVGDDGRPYVGTAHEGRVYTVDDAHTSSVVADTDERQVGAIVLAGAHKLIATSDPAVFHEVRGTGGASAVWTSKPLDAGLRAHFGRLSWRSTGDVELSTRTGNTLTPDTTWSDWSAALTAPGVVASPAGRFVQVRARFARDPAAVVSQVLLPFVTDNLRPVVTSVEAAPKGAAVPSRDALPPSGGELAAHTSVLRVSWKVDNADADPLRYRLAYRLDGQAQWRDLTRPDEVVTKTEYEWETATLPEGRYRVRVEASDDGANPPDRAERHALESGAVLVDNTPPSFARLATQGRHVLAEVHDGLGPIARVDVAFDGRTEWHPFLPKDGVFDEAIEALDLDVSTLVSAGAHLVAVRAFDQAGNAVVREIELK